MKTYTLKQAEKIQDAEWHVKFYSRKAETAQGFELEVCEKQVKTWKAKLKRLTMR
jgi:hypothetical protein